MQPNIVLPKETFGHKYYQISLLKKTPYDTVWVCSICVCVLTDWLFWFLLWIPKSVLKCFKLVTPSEEIGAFHFKHCQILLQWTACVWVTDRICTVVLVSVSHVHRVTTWTSFILHASDLLSYWRSNKKRYKREDVLRRIKKKLSANINWGVSFLDTRTQNFLKF